MKLALAAAIAINFEKKNEAGANELSFVPVFFWFTFFRIIEGGQGYYSRQRIINWS